MANVTKTDEVVNEIYRRIKEEIYQRGQRLPAEANLAEEMNVSRQTIRIALRRLQSENALDIIPRSGVFVRNRDAKALIGPPASSLFRKNAAMDRLTSWNLLLETDASIRFLEPPSIVPAEQWIAQKMSLQVGVELFHRRRIYRENEMPYRILDSYYLAIMAGSLKNENDLPFGQWVLDHPEDKQTFFAYEGLDCRMPSAQEAKLLNISRNQPVVDIERWIVADRKAVIEYTHIIANAALHRYSYTYLEEENWSDLMNKMGDDA